MGRRIYADEIGLDKDDTFVHKFWFGVQSSDVDPYLEAYQPEWLLAELGVEDEAKIKKQVTGFKTQFKKDFGFTYAEYMKGEEVNKFAENSSETERQLAASRINLGVHLLETIKNMKVAGIDWQQLTIEC